MMPTIDEKRAQVVAQCKVVQHIAQALANVHSDLVKYYEHPSTDEIMLDLAGDRTAGLMEALGDILNGMDASTDEDDWTAPVFAAAHVMFPQDDCPDNPNGTEGT